MEKEQHQIDQVFREALGPYEISPPPGSWEIIAAQLEGKKYSRRIFWIRSIAASLLLVLALGTGYFWGSRQNQSPANTDFSAQDRPRTEMNSQNNANLGSASLVQQNEEMAILNGNNAQSRKTFRKESPTNTSGIPNIGLVSSTVESNVLADNSTLNLITSNQDFYPLSGKSMNIVSRTEESHPALPQATYLTVDMGKEIIVSLDENEEEKGQHSWEIEGQLSPLYAFRDIKEKGGAVANLNNDFQQNFYQSEKPLFSYAGGMKVQYHLSARLGIQGGLSFSSSGLSSDINVPLAMSKITSDAISGWAEKSPNTSSSNSTGNIDVLKFLEATSSPRNNYQAPTDAFNDYEYTKGNLKQKFGYVEFPLLLKYKLVDRDLDVSLTGGVITNILAYSNYFLETKDYESQGKTGDLKTLNYSGALGLGVSVPVGQDLRIGLEPTLRYFINPISSSSYFETHPYSFGIFTGVSYTF